MGATPWKLVALQYMEALEERHPGPVWLSTSGEGVAWLHFRLDSDPKYYQYRPFAEGGILMHSDDNDADDDDDDDEDDDNDDDDDDENANISRPWNRSWTSFFI